MGKWLKKIPAKRPWIEDNNVGNKNTAELMFLLLLAWALGWMYYEIKPLAIRSDKKSAKTICFIKKGISNMDIHPLLEMMNIVSWGIS